MTTPPKPFRRLRPPTFASLPTRLLPGLRALLLFGALLSVTTPVSAHDASVAAIKIVRQSPDAWAFELQTPLHGLDRAMRRFAETRSRDLDDLGAGSTRYKELIVEYVKATFELVDEGATDGGGSPSLSPALGSGRIKLGEHVSILVFDIENMPAALDRLTLRLPYMASNMGQQNILWLIDGDRSQRHVLGAENEFTVVDADFFERAAGALE